MPHQDLLARLDEIASTTVRAAALEVDLTGAFPGAAVDELRAAGLLGLPLDLGTSAWAVERLARECASTAMVFCMHQCGARVLGAHADEATREALGRGELLTTLAFSEVGSRSHFWAPVSTARRVAGGVRLDAKKSWVTSASHADVYVWSSGTLEVEGASTIWQVPAKSAGLEVEGPFDGLGLRGNDSSPVGAEGVVVPESAVLGGDGAGFGVMMEIVLPAFNLMTAGCALGLAEAATQAAAAHCSGTRYEHLSAALRDLPTIRAYLARMRCKTDAAKALLSDSISALENGEPTGMLRVLQSKAVAAEAALEVTELGMRVCGGAAFRKEAGIERSFRDARAASVMAPTTDVLYDFIGKAVTGMELF